ncbi:MAG TPA: glycosyltransferase family 2 protein, partial [Firmicutes bacterium]|nr:glycosyltransferase family 2 protein [Bacillota bacterium]
GENNAPRVGLVILNYNGAWVLKGLFESLDRILYPNLKVFFIDNHSTDSSMQFVENYLPKFPLDVTVNDSNLLFSGGNNVGIRKAIDWNADYVMLLNNDTIVPPELIGSMVDFLESRPDAGIAGPLIHFKEPPGTIWSAGGKVSTWWGIVRHRGIREKDTGQFSSAEKMDYVSGCALIARRRVFERIGLLDEKFPMYYEDTDFCFRAKKAGFECWYVPSEPLIHLVSFSAGGQLSKFKIGRRFRSGMRFFASHARFYQWPTILLGQIYEIVRVALMVLTGKIGRSEKTDA